MALWRGIGARKDSVTPFRGTAPIEVRKTVAALFARPGVLPGGASSLVTGDATWAYNVGIANFVTSRGASDGDQLYGNDSIALIGATGIGSTVPIAPGAGLQRIDIMWTRHPTNLENADTSSEPLFGVASGVAASSNPVAPTIPAGALELGRNTMTSAATSTLSAGNTITQSALYTALRGAPVPVRNQTEQDALVTFDGALADRLDTRTRWQHNGTAWFPISGAMPGGRVVRGATAYTIPAGTWTPLTAYWAVDQPAVGIAAFGGSSWVVTTPGVYDVEAGLYLATVCSAEMIIKLNDVTASVAGTILASTASGVLNSTALNIRGRVRLNAGDTLTMFVYANIAAAWANSAASSEYRASYFGLRFVEPLR